MRSSKTKRSGSEMKKQVQYRHGDLLSHKGRFVMHGCNAQGVMGSGVAKEIRATYPLAYTKYREKYEEENKLVMGSVVAVDCGRHVIFNAITQEFFGKDGRRYVDYSAISTALVSINKLINDAKREFEGNRFAQQSRGYGWTPFEEEEPIELAMPLIGAGLGGGDWGIISNILSQDYEFQPVVYIRELEQYQKIVKEYQQVD
jgi:O-acetyl-ADP-ribose deacetylase (regulator of RNase III)